MSIQVGDRLPSVALHEGTPKNKQDMSTYFAGKKAVLFAVPGAFTPGCSKVHLPSYINQADSIFASGVDIIACVAVNDAFVMTAWGEATGAEGKITMLADPTAEFTKAIGLDVHAGGLGGTRSKRYSMVIEDGVVSALNVEPDGFGLTCSLADGLADAL